MSLCARESRLYFSNWGDTTNPVVYVPNEHKDIRLVALAGNDTSGSVVITPQTGNDLAGNPVFVTSRAPLVIPSGLRGPFTVSMVNGAANITGSLVNNVLDLFLYNTIPTIAPRRADYRKSFQQLGVASTTPNDIYVPVFNRKCISVTVGPTLGGGATCDLTISGVNFSSFGATFYTLRQLFTKTAGTAARVFHLYPSNAPVSGVTGEVVPKQFDMLVLTTVFSATHASNVADWEVLASDDA